MVIDKKGDLLQQVIVKAWADEGFKQRLLTDPMRTLADEGASLPAGMEVRTVENTDRVFHLVLPAKPTHLSDLDLEKIAAGGALPESFYGEAELALVERAFIKT